MRPQHDEEHTLRLVRAAQEGDVETVRRLLELGVAPDSRNEHAGIEEATPLMYAVLNGDVPMARLLVRYGASLTAADAWGETVGSYALSPKDPRPILDFLFESGLPVDAPDEDGMTLLMHAMGISSEALLLFLMERGASLHARDARGWTPLMHAIRWDDEPAARLLLTCGAEVDARDEDGVTPLMLAVRMVEDDWIDLRSPERPARWYQDDYSENDGEVVDTMRLLLNYGADAHAADTWGWSPLLLALACGYRHSVQLLRAHGATLTGLMPEVLERARSFAEKNHYLEQADLLEAALRA